MRKDLAAWLTDVDTSKRILEIGPLCGPVFSKDEADVYYADVRSTKQLRQLHADNPALDPASILDVDVVVKTTYAEAFKNMDKFEYVVLSHVLEHIPRLIAFFLDIVNVLSRNGKLYIFLPDHRYCLDHFRSPTSFAEAYYTHVNDLPYPPWRVLDCHLESTTASSPELFWSGCVVNAPLLASRRPFAFAGEKMREAEEKGHVSLHYSVFTQKSFLLLLYNMVNARLLPFRCISFFPTKPNDFTFGAVLAACPALPGDDLLTKRELLRIATMIDNPSVF